MGFLQRVPHIFNIIQSRITPFLDWWFDELAACIPTYLKQNFTKHEQLTTIQLSSNEAIIWCTCSAGAISESRISLAELEHAPMPTVSPYINATLLLQPEDVYLTRFCLPKETQEKWREAAEFEMRKHNPFKNEVFYADIKLIENLTNKDSITIEASIITSSKINTAQILSRKLGYNSTLIGISDNKSLTPHTVFYKNKPKRSLHLSASSRTLLISALFFIGSVAIGAYNLNEKNNVLSKQASELKIKATEVERAKERLDRRHSAISLLASTSLNTSPQDLLLEVAKLIPHDAWLSELTLTKDELRLIGYTTSAALLIDQLTPSTILETPRSNAPITSFTSPATGKKVERFDISVTIQRTEK